MKTPEQMAMEYIKDVETARNPSVAATAFPQMQRCFLAGYEAAKDQLADVSKVMPQWISVKDRLPEEGQIALTICDNGKMFLLQKVSDEMFGVPIYWKYCCGFDKELQPNESYCYNVTHWQPLPAPPKEEK